MERKIQAAKQLIQEVKLFGEIDSILVLHPWKETSPTIVSLIKCTEFSEEQDLTRYYKNLFPRNDNRVRIEVVLGTARNPQVCECLLSDHLTGGQHRQLFQNTVNATDVVIVGNAVMSPRSTILLTWEGAYRKHLDTL